MIEMYINDIRLCTEKLNSSHNFDPDIFMYIKHPLYIWCRETYIGEVKSPQIQNLFQKFFMSLKNYINRLEQNEVTDKFEKAFIESITYNGLIYRMLGYDSSRIKECNKNLKVLYNDYYVSWSSEEHPDGENYLKSKLYGNITHIEGYTNNIFAIDVVGFNDFIGSNICNSNEKEIIFPTFKKNITKIWIERG